MRIAFLILVIIHGLIHLLGFVKAYELSEIKALTQPISKTFGAVWLIAFIMLSISALLFVFRNSNWWMFGAIAVLISQFLIIYFWQDARAGTIPNIIILIAVIIGYGVWNFNGKFVNDVKDGLMESATIRESILTEQDLQNLPEPVKNYIIYSGAIGKPKVKNFKLEFTGHIRKREPSEWMEFTTEQYSFIETSKRLFYMDATMKHLPVAGYHCFINGTAYMDIRLLSLFRVQYFDGEKMNIAETVTFFNDMCCMAPATLIDKRIKWLETTGNEVKCEFINNGISIFARLYFNDKGELTNFISDDRYGEGDNKTMINLRWATPLKDYKEINGYKIAGFAQTIYTYPEGDFCYGEFLVKNVIYNYK